MGKLVGQAGMSAPAPKRDRTRAIGDLPQLRALLSSEISPLSASCSDCWRRSKLWGSIEPNAEAPTLALLVGVSSSKAVSRPRCSQGWGILIPMQPAVSAERSS